MKKNHTIGLAHLGGARTSLRLHSPGRGEQENSGDRNIRQLAQQA